MAEASTSADRITAADFPEDTAEDFPAVLTTAAEADHPAEAAQAEDN